MTFVTVGLAIAGVVSIAVPILIHLLSRQRRRPVEWGAMRFLIEALRRYRWRLQLEQFLLLAARCLILVLLGAALARPILEAAGLLEAAGSRVVWLVIDNGLASGARPAETTSATALRKSVEDAARVVRALGPGDVVGIITAARPARGLVVPPSSDHGAVIELLRTLEPSQAPTDFPAALGLLQSVLEELPADRDQAVVYLLSEFRSGSAALEGALATVAPPDSDRVTLLAAPAADHLARNVQVTSVEPLRGLVLSSAPESAGQVTVAVSRSGTELGRDVTRVRLMGEGLPPIEPRVVNWEPGQSTAEVDFVVDLAGRGEGALPITAAIDDDALGADNRRHTVLASRRQIRGLLVDRRSFSSDEEIEQLTGGQWLRRALQPSQRSPVDVVDVDPAALDAVDVRGVDVALVARPDLVTDRGWSVLREFVDTGGLLIVVPPGESRVHPWTDRLLENMDLPWRISLEVVEREEGLALAEEQPPSELMRLLSGELAELVRPVRAFRILPVTEADPILTFADGTPMTVAGSPLAPGAEGGPPAHGLVVYLTVSPELPWTNLPAKPLMVPLVHELIRQGVGLIRTGQRYAVGEQPGMGLGATARALVGPNGETISIGSDGRPTRPLSKAGLYGIFDQAMQRTGTVAVNIDPAAGRTDPQPAAAVLEWLKRSGPWQLFDPEAPAAALGGTGSGAPIAGLLLFAVLALVVVETALARWFSHALPAVERPLGPGLGGEASMARGGAV